MDGKRQKIWIVKDRKDEQYNTEKMDSKRQKMEGSKRQKRLIVKDRL